MNSINKIGYVFPALELYGAQRVALDYAHKYAQMGYQVVIHAGGEGALSSEVNPISIIYFYKKKNKINRVFRLLWGSLRLLWQLKKNNYDVIISFAPFHNRLLCLFKSLKLIHTKLIIEDHAYPPKSNVQEFPNPLTHFLVNLTEKLYNKADVLKVLTTECSDYYKNKLKRANIFIYHNLINFQRIDQLLNHNSHTIYPKSKKRIITLGRLVDQKNLFFLIEAFALINKNIHCELVILGDGPLKSSLQAKTKELNLENIIFQQSSPYNYSFIQSADVFVICSYWEGLVTTIFEAMYLQTPVVASYFQAGLDFQLGTNQERGYITPSNNINHFANKIIDVLNNHPPNEIKFKKDNAAHFVEEKLNIEKNFQFFLKKLFSCIN